MRKRINLDLRMFEGGAGAGAGDGAGAGAAGAAGEGGTAAPQGPEGGEAAGNETEQGQEETVPEMTPEERRAEYQRLIKGEYKDLYGEDVKAQVSRRYKENAQLHQKLDEYAPLMDMLAVRYGVKDGSVRNIMDAIEKDDAFYEEAAMKEGVPVEMYKKFVKLQAENKALEEARIRAENIRQRDEAYARWDREAAECRQRYPDFDIYREIQTNPDFVRLLGSGVHVTQAYQACHFDEIQRGVINHAEKATKKRVADTIRSGAQRPAENSVDTTPASNTKYDVGNMSDADFAKLVEDVKSGRVKSL